jgi:uncharacterized membrane protein YecN with MAPEG domain
VDGCLPEPSYALHGAREANSTMNPLLLCSAALVLLFAILSFNVSRMRRKRRSFPELPEADVIKAIRAHGNAAEYTPLFVALFLYLNSVQPGPSLYVIGIAMLATASRFAHAAGMLLTASVAERHPLRFFGALATYICLFGLGGVLLLRAL